MNKLIEFKTQSFCDVVSQIYNIRNIAIEIAKNEYFKLLYRLAINRYDKDCYDKKIITRGTSYLFDAYISIKNSQKTLKDLDVYNIPHPDDFSLIFEIFPESFSSKEYIFAAYHSGSEMVEHSILKHLDAIPENIDLYNYTKMTLKKEIIPIVSCDIFEGYWLEYMYKSNNYDSWVGRYSPTFYERVDKLTDTILTEQFFTNEKWKTMSAKNSAECAKEWTNYRENNFKELRSKLLDVIKPTILFTNLSHKGNYTF